MTAFLTAAAGSVAAQEGTQDLQHRRLDLAVEARKLSDSGDPGRAEALVGEVYAIDAEICWNEGRLAAAEANWREAVSRGWRGKSPWQKEADAKAEARQEGPQDPFDPTSVIAQEQLDPLDRPDQPRLLEEVDIWPYAALAPYHRGGASTWHSLMGTPPFEEAVVLPRGARQARMWMDVVTADVLYDNGKGVTRWGGTLTRENFELNYSITDAFVVGGRLTAGEIIGEEPIRLFEGSRQIVPSGERGYGPGSVVLRAKLAGDVNGAFDAGVLAEVKVPVAASGNLLTSGTFDLGVVGLFTKTFGQIVANVNLGFVLPIGQTGIFVDDFDTANTYLMGAFGFNAIFAPQLTMGFQVEANTSAFSDVDFLAVPIITLTGHSNVRVGDRLFWGLSIGHGLSSLSGDWLFGTSLEVVF